MKLNRKLVLVLALLMSVVMGTTGTIAYLTDTEEAVNVMTLGNVDIEQLEQEYDENGELQAYTPNKPLYPAYVAANGDITGAIDKIVSVKNVGNSDAYVRTLIAFEAGNLSFADFTKYIHTEFDTSANVNPNWLSVPVTVGGVNYYVACMDYDMLTADSEAKYSLKKVYMDKEATNEIVAQFGTTYDIAVISQAVQTTNMPNSAAAWDASFGAFNETNAATWFGGVSIPTTSVATAKELTDALAAGQSVVLTKSVDLKDAELTIAEGQNVIIDLNGNTLSGASDVAAASRLITVKKGASLTLKNGSVSFKANQPDLTWAAGFPAYADNTINCAGTLVIDGAVVENRTQAGGASYCIDCYPGANLIVNSGRVDGHGKNAIRMFCNSNTEPTNVTINGGTVTGSRALWLQLPQSSATIVPPVNLTVNGGELIATGNDECSIYSYSYGASFENTNITLNGGLFANDVAFGGGKNKATKENVTITGGIFMGDLGRWVTADDFEAIAKPGSAVVATTNNDLAQAIANGEKQIYVAAGSYTFPNSQMTSDMTITCVPGTQFTNAKLNANGATIIGATFSDTPQSNTVNGIYKDCVFTGTNGLRYGYAGETVVFENCVFSGSTFGAHFDGGANDVVFKECVFSGFNTFGGEITKLTLDGCTFVANGKGNYNGVNLWGNTEMKDCEFIFDGSVQYEWVDTGDKTNGINVTFTNCFVNDGTTKKGMETIVGDYGTNNTITINGKVYDLKAE